MNEPIFAGANRPLRPLDEAHRIALEAQALLRQAKETLAQSAPELSKSKRLPKRGVKERGMAVHPPRGSENESARLLEESHILERHLRTLTHPFLSADEDGWEKVSLRLNDEIAQTLLGIEVRLLDLKNEAAVRHSDLIKEITATQLLVEESVESIALFFHELDAPTG